MERLKLFFKSFITYFKDLRKTYGIRFILFLIVSQFMIKGFLFRAILSIALPLFKSLGIDAAKLEILAALALSPWTIKPIIGVISDKIAIFGYHKKYYILISTLIGIISSIFPLIIGWQVPILLTIFFAFIHLEISVTDLLTEGKYAELMRKHPENGTNIITFVQGLQSLGMVAGILFVGPMADEQLYLPVFIVITVITVTPIVPTMLGWLPEVQYDVDAIKVNYGWRVIVLVCATGLAGPVLATLSAILDEPNQRLWVLLCGLIVIATASTVSFWVMPRDIAYVALYSAIISISKPGVGTAMDYFYTADEICLPGGPHFSYKYYITYTGIISSFFSILAVVLYQLIFSNWRYRSALLFTTIISSAGGLVDLVILLRLNLVLGIPDKVFYIGGEAILESVTTMLYWIPSSAILSAVCPRGMEASAFAFLAGISNYGRMVSELSGAAALNAVGLNTTGECNFDALPYLVLVCHIILPAIIGVPAVLLIPNLSQREEMDSEEVELSDIESEDVSLDLGLKYEFEKQQLTTIPEKFHDFQMDNTPESIDEEEE